MTDTPGRSAHNQAVGARGEHRAATYLQERGYEILERNWRCPAGEVDIVAREPGGAVVHVEVKARTNNRFGHAVGAISATKLARMRKVAGAWRGARGHGPAVRLDVVCIDYATAPETIWHIEGADR